MKKTTFREKLLYRYENFMSKGGGALFFSLLILFVVAFLISVFIRKLFLWINPQSELFSNFWGHIWLTFLQIIDPGAIAEDTDASLWMKVSGIVTTFLGIVIFSMLIAFITTKFEEVMYNFRKGRSKVIEAGHTLILGWNERVIDILDELILANESEKSATVVILADKDKEEMDDELSKSISDSKTTRIVTREGSTSSLTDLGRVNAAVARSVIILADCLENADDDSKKNSDAIIIKTILALVAMQDGDNQLNIVAEIFKEQNRAILDTFESDNIIAVDKTEILGKALVQTSLTSGLEMVFNEIFSFDGAEIYFYGNKWNKISFGELIYHFPDGVPLGIYKAGGQLIVRPGIDEIMEEGDEVLILASDDSAVDYKKNSVYQPKDFNYVEKRIEKNKKRELILGWHSIGGIIVSEYSDFLIEGSEIDIMIDRPSDTIKTEISRMQKEYTSLKIRLLSGNPLLKGHLEKVNPFNYDNVIILSQDENDYSPEKTDSDTLVILLLLRKIQRDSNIEYNKTKIITQVLNSENQELIHQSNVDDFLISNKLISMLFAQLSEECRLKLLYSELFGEAGSEIYLKPAAHYFENLPVTAAFGDIINASLKRDEICFGIQMSESAHDAGNNFGIILNPPKDKVFTIDKNEYLVVLAEDET